MEDEKVENKKVEIEKIEIEDLEDEDSEDDELEDDESEIEKVEIEKSEPEDSEEEELKIEELQDFLPLGNNYDEGTRCMSAFLKLISAEEAFYFHQKVKELKEKYGVTELELCPFEREKEPPAIIEKLKKTDAKYIEFLENETFEEFLKRTRTQNLIP